MNWTSETPTEVGWYLNCLGAEDNGEARAVYVTEVDIEVWRTTDVKARGEWCRIYFDPPQLTCSVDELVEKINKEIPPNKAIKSVSFLYGIVRAINIIRENQPDRIPTTEEIDYLCNVLPNGNKEIKHD